MLKTQDCSNLGARTPNFKVVWAEFSTLSWFVFEIKCIFMAYISTPTSNNANSAQVLSYCLKFEQLELGSAKANGR